MAEPDYFAAAAVVGKDMVEVVTVYTAGPAEHEWNVQR